MKRIFLPLLMMMAVAVTCVSCLGDGDEYEYTDNTGITAFTLGNLKQTFHRKTKDGLRDSTYTKSVSFSSTKFYIDQIEGLIYNPDSLPLGVDGTKVLCSVSSYNASTVGIKSMTSDTLSYFTGSDSTDFSKPRELHVYSNSGRGHKKYTVSVNIHRQDSSYVWKRMAQADASISDFGSITSMRLASTDGGLLLAASDGTQTRLFFHADGQDGWSESNAANAVLPADAYESLVAYDGTAYILNTATGDVTSFSGSATKTKRFSGLQRLVGADAAHIYAYTAADGGVSLCTVDMASGSTAAVGIDDEATWLPTRDITSAVLPLKTNSGASRIVLAGNRETAYADTAAVVWSKLTDTQETADDEQFMFYDTQRVMRMPRLKGLQMAVYDGHLLAIGGAPVQEEGVESAPKQLYESRDNGLSWQRDTVAALPDGFECSPTAFAMATDKDNFVWIVCGRSGQVWRGRANYLGWRKEQGVYDKKRKF